MNVILGCPINSPTPLKVIRTVSFPRSEGVRINGFGVSGDEFCAVAGRDINNVKATSAFSATNFCAFVRFMEVAPLAINHGQPAAAKLVQPAAPLLSVRNLYQSNPSPAWCLKISASRT